MQKVAFLAAALVLLGPDTIARAQAPLIELNDAVRVEAFGMTVDQMDDMDVFDRSGRKLGEVEEVLGTADGSARALVVDFDREAAGRDDDATVPIGDVTLSEGRLILGASAEAIGAYPIYVD